MNTFSTRTILNTILIVLLASLPSSAASGAERPVRAFIVHSYEMDNVCGRSQGEGIETELRAAYGESLEIAVHYMNTKTVNRDREAMATDAEEALRKIADFDPDVVFTVDDNAFREVGLKLMGRPFPVVFTGMNGQPAAYAAKVPFLDAQGRPTANITGVYEKLHAVTSLRVMKEILPDLKRVAVILDDSPTGHAIRKQLTVELAANDSDVETDIHVVSTIDAYRKLITEIDQDPQIGAVYNIVLSIRDAAGKACSADQNFRLFLETCRKPSMALNFEFARKGLFGGASVDFTAMGALAGRQGIAILSGTPVADEPVADAAEVMLTFNQARAEMLGIQLPYEMLASSNLFFTMPLLDIQ